MSRLSRGATGHHALGRLRLVAVALGAVLAITACSGAPPLPARDRNWQQDIAYLARVLPEDRAAGLGSVSPAAWHAAASRLETQVPRLTDAQVITKLAQMVAMLHDDETLVTLPPTPFLPVDAQWVGGGLYLMAAPAADRAVLGAQLLAVDGRPVGQVLARAGTTIDAEDPQLLSNSETGALDNLTLLRSLGLAGSAAAAALTVRTRSGQQETVRIAAIRSAFVFGWPVAFATQESGLAHLPLPLYRQDTNQPYWLRVMPAQHAVYLKYNQCLPDNGFQRLAARALGLLAANRDYRLIVDLRDNQGGDTGPFQSLVSALQDHPQLNAPGRVIGLIDQFTDSSATSDAEALKDTGAVLIGQPPADPLDTWGDVRTFRLPKSGLVVDYTTATVNSTGAPLGSPDVVVRPTLAQILAGDDPVLAAALNYRPGGR